MFFVKKWDIRIQNISVLYLKKPQESHQINIETATPDSKV